MATTKGTPARRKGRKEKGPITETSFASVTVQYLDTYADAFDALANNHYVDKRLTGKTVSDPDGFRGDTRSGEAWGGFGFGRK